MPIDPAKVDVIPGSKKCARCKLVKSIAVCFHKEKSGRVASYCKTCNKIVSYTCGPRKITEARRAYQAAFRNSPLGKLVSRRSHVKGQAAKHHGTQAGLLYEREYASLTAAINTLKRSKSLE